MILQRDRLADPAQDVDAPEGLSAVGVNLGYRRRTVCSDLSLDISPNSFTVIVGPNACGKSTLLKGFARLVTPTAGQICLDGRPVDSWKPRHFAQEVGLLPQSAIAPDGIRVAELVRRGRSPHHTALSRWSAEDAEAVHHALETTGLSALSGRLVQELSGGQRQRVWIAMVLAQQSRIVLLDEPTTFLDLTHQYSVLNLAESIRVSESRTVVAVLHDLNQACQFATHLVVMSEGQIVDVGAPSDIVTSDLVEDVYHLKCDIRRHDADGSILVIPRR